MAVTARWELKIFSGASDFMRIRFKRFQKYIATVFLAGIIIISGTQCVYAIPQSKKSGKKTEKPVTKKTTKPASTAKVNKTGSGKNAKSKQPPKKTKEPKTKEEIQRLQSDTQKEIARTREEIRKNEVQVKKSLSELGRLQSNIQAGEKAVADSKLKVANLQSSIDTLHLKIAGEEESLKHLRTEYLKSLNRLRSKRKTNSDLAFIFSSKDFNQALRRMRYLKQVSAWREKKSAEIEERMKQMQARNEQLSAMVTAQKDELIVQEKAQNTLKGDYARQDMVVKELKKNGQALKNHLAQKQKEANSLNSRIAALIAEEQRKAEAERKAKEAKAKATQEQDLAKATGKQGSSGSSEVSKDRKNNEEFAQARKRRPRGEASKEKSTAGTSSDNKKSTALAGNFEGMKGSLPRPVAGEFKVTSRFGRHSLPELPDVMYDNPGIDAQTSAGASALAVYKGKVSGVYVIPGYSTVVIVNHGNYYTVYGNLVSPAVKVGDMVGSGQALGKLAADEGDPSKCSVHFEVWRNRDKLNPLDWIK